MRITAIKLARVIALFDPDELAPDGRVSLTRVTAEIAKKFQFQKFPTPGEQPDNKKGVAFLDGTWNDTPVMKLTIYNDGIIVNTRRFDYAISRNPEGISSLGKAGIGNAL